MVLSAQLKTRNYKDLIVYQKALDNSTNLFKFYKAQKPLWLERFIIEQLLRASASIGANVVEGYGRGSRADYKRFLYIARGSCLESEYWMNFLTNIRSQDEKFLSSKIDVNTELLKMLTTMLKNLK